MKTILVASNNEHKIVEIKEILKDLPFKVISLKEAGIDVDVEETGSTFLENAYIKAKAIYDILEDKKNYLVMSDDSGITVDHLDGAPGVYSARFAGEHGNSKKNNDKLLDLMKGVPSNERGAAFVCAIVVIYGEDKAIKVQGEVRGFVTEKECGDEGFGYDPLFYVPEFDKTFAEVSAEEKNAVSHRARALQKIKVELKKII